MSAKTVASLGLKVTTLTIILFLCRTVAPGISRALLPPTDPMPPVRAVQNVDPKEALVASLIMCACQSIVLSYTIVRSRWSGWRLTATIFVVHYGVTTFLSQIETVVFLVYLQDIFPAEMIPYLFIQGAVVAVLFAPLAVLVHGKMGRDREPQEPNQRLVMPWTEWGWKLPLGAVLYVAIYLSFGWFVCMPLAGEAFQNYYGDLQGPMWVLPLQLLRGLIWTALALPVVRMMKGKPWEARLAVGLLFSVLMGFLLLVPTEVMPDAIRLAHLVEVSSSNLLFGWLVVWLLSRRQSPARSLLTVGGRG